MRIAIDYDGTFSTDSSHWFEALTVLKSAGYEIIGVTMRSPDMKDTMCSSYFDICDKVIFTSSEFKSKYLLDNNYPAIDIWIDDKPSLIQEPCQIIHHPI